MSLRFLRWLLIGGVLALTLCACGQRGPLKIPEDDAAQEQT